MMHNPTPAARWLPVILWMGVIFLLSSQTNFPRLTPAIPDLQNVIGHLVEYAILGALLLRALRHTPPVRRPYLWTVLIVMLYAASDEGHQYFVPGRHCDPLDWLTDVTGACLMLLLHHWWSHRQALQPASRRLPPPGQPPAPVES